MIKSLIGERIRLMRNRAGYTQKAFARACGLDRTYLSGVESGKRNISIETMFKIADALNLSLAELCDVSVPANRTILLRINGQCFILQSKSELTADIKDYIEALCRCAYDEGSEFEETLTRDRPDASINDLSPYELAALFQRIVREYVGIEVVFKGIDLEVSVRDTTW